MYFSAKIHIWTGVLLVYCNIIHTCKQTNITLQYTNNIPVDIIYLYVSTKIQDSLWLLLFIYVLIECFWNPASTRRCQVELPRADLRCEDTPRSRGPLGGRGQGQVWQTHWQGFTTIEGLILDESSDKLLNNSSILDEWKSNNSTIQ